MITLRNKEDIVEVWSTASKGGNILFWCDGLRPNSVVASTGKKQKTSDSSTAPSKKDTSDQVQNYVENLKKAHGENIL